MSISKDAQFQMFEEIKEQLKNIDSRLSRLEKQIYEHEDSSFREVLGKQVAGANYVFGEFKKAQAEIILSLNSISAIQNMKWWKRIFR